MAGFPEAAVVQDFSMSQPPPQIANDFTNEKYILAYDFLAMVRLALGTAVLVSTVLLIPDTIAIIPSSHSPWALLIRAIGLWFSAFIQWSLGFLCILKLAALINRGIVIDDTGIQISRFSKKIGWSEIVGWNGDARNVVSRLMFSKSPEFRVQLYVNEKNNVKAKNIDSLFFQNAQFESLMFLICRSSFGFVPDTAHVTISNGVGMKSIQVAHRKVTARGKLFTIYIAVMMLLFTGRSAARNYLYNEAAQAMNRCEYQMAKRDCELSIAIDSTFPYAHDRLARCEFRLHNNDEAEKQWQTALRLKPDLVSAKVGLSNVYMARGKYEKAHELLTSAVRLEPRDIAAFLNLGYLNLKLGRQTDGIKSIENAVNLAPQNSTVRVLSADAFLAAGRRDRAADLLKGVEEKDVEQEKKSILKRLRNDLGEEKSI